MIAITGARLAGLSLGQGLTEVNIHSRIFELDPNANCRAQGYRIRIFDDSAKSLQRLLPENSWHAFHATCAEVRHSGHPMSALAGKAPSGRRGHPHELQQEDVREIIQG